MGCKASVIVAQPAAPASRGPPVPRKVNAGGVKKTIAIENAIGYELPAWFPATGKTTD